MTAPTSDHAPDNAPENAAENAPENASANRRPAAPDDSTGERSGERIAKLLARAGIASRREVERMIADGRVRLNDQVITTPATVLPNLKGISVDGKPVKAAEATRLFVFHKPSGLITAERDPAGRPTIYTALRNALPEGTGRVMPVGRLDYNTEGLLLLTNDGELKRAMELPSTGLPRTYRARTFGDITQTQLEDLIEGVTIDGMHYGKIDANMERRTGRNQWIEITITEGKNREVRRVLEYLGLEVSRLLRTSYGPFQLLDLPRGQAVEIRQVEVERFRKALLGGGDAYVPSTAPQQARARIARARPTSRKVPAGKPPLGKAPSSGAQDGRSDARPPQGRQPVAGKLSPRAPRPADGAAPRRAGSRDDRPRTQGPRTQGARTDRPREDRPRDDGARRANPRNPDGRSTNRREADSRAPNPRAPNPRGESSRSPNSRSPNSRSPNSRSPNPRSPSPGSTRPGSSSPQGRGRPGPRK